MATKVTGRLCSNCRRSDVEFYLTKHYYCVECTRAKAKEAHKRRRTENPDYYRQASLKANYGITLEEYDEMYDKQNGGCSICGGVNANGHRLAVDHNHETGNVRGLLCHNCNRAIGLFHDDLRLLENAMNYLERSDS